MGAADTGSVDVTGAGAAAGGATGGAAGATSGGGACSEQAAAKAAPATGTRKIKRRRVVMLGFPVRELKISVHLKFARLIRL
jgi:hypothetical protein